MRCGASWLVPGVLATVLALTACDQGAPTQTPNRTPPTTPAPVTPPMPGPVTR